MLFKFLRGGGVGVPGGGGEVGVRLEGGSVDKSGGGVQSRGVRVGGGYEGGPLRGVYEVECFERVCVGGGVRVVRWDGVHWGYVRREGLGVRVRGYKLVAVVGGGYVAGGGCVAWCFYLGGEGGRLVGVRVVRGWGEIFFEFFFKNPETGFVQ